MVIPRKKTPKTRRIDGKLFRLWSSYQLKRYATRDADILRKAKFNARIVKVPGGYGVYSNFDVRNQAHVKQFWGR